jgi:hypothetical protein
VKLRLELVQFLEVQHGRRMGRFGCGCRRLRSSRDLVNLFGGFALGAEMRPDLVGKIVFERTGMGFLLLDTNLGQVLQERIALHFQFTRQFVDPYLSHAWFFFSLTSAQTLGGGNLQAGSIKALAALFHASPPPSPGVAGSSCLFVSCSPEGPVPSFSVVDATTSEDSSGTDALSTAASGPVVSSIPIATSGADTSVGRSAAASSAAGGSAVSGVAAPAGS